jgi:hypothetical protein
MEPTIVSLEATDMDWFRLVRFVETSGTPLWLEAGGEVRGVLLPPVQARRLFGQSMEPNRGEGILSHDRSGRDMPAPEASDPQLGCNLDTEGTGRATPAGAPSNRDSRRI